MTALLLLGPATPMLFQGQEFAASAPFLYFADHSPELAPLVAKGRKEFLSQFPGIADSESAPYLASPHAEETFFRCKLDLTERAKHRQAYALHRDLLRLRRTDPVFSQPRGEGVDGAVLSQDAFVLRFFGGDSEDRLLLINLGSDLLVAPVAEPLLAPKAGSEWKVTWSSESPKYGGLGILPVITDTGWRVVGQAAFVFSCRSLRSGPDSKS
jgi:maltooligosyltrehalose trehalohydrolase